MRAALLAICTIFPSFLRIYTWKLLGFNVGENCHISMFSVIIAENIEFGSDVTIKPFAIFYQLRELKIGSGSMISYFTIVYSVNRSGFLRTGKRFGTGLLTIIDATSGVTIGDQSAVGPQSTLSTHANIFPVSHGYSNRYEAITIGHRVWIMMSVKIMPGIKIVDDVHVAPGTVVAKSINRPGLFMNSYLAESDISVPLPKSRFKRVDKQFVDEWFDTVFDEFIAYMENAERISGSVTNIDGGWKVCLDGSAIEVFDGRTEYPVAKGQNEVVLLFGQYTAERDLNGIGNWIDCYALEYHLPYGLKKWDLFRRFFYEKHGLLLIKHID